MPAPNYPIVEKKYYLAALGIPLTDEGLYTVDELREMYYVRDLFPGVEITLEKNGFQPGGATIAATDNGDGGVTLATTPSSKFPKYSYSEATYFKIANAVQLAINPPQPPSQTPSAGVTQRAAREDHVHLIPAAKPSNIRIGSGSQVVIGGKQAGTATPGATPRALFWFIWLSQPSRAPMSFSKVSFKVDNAAAAGGVGRIAMWKTTVNGEWDFTQKIFESGAISTTSTGLKDYVVALNNIPEGIYVCSYVGQVAQAGVAGVETGLYGQGGNPGQMTDFWYQDGISGAYPGTPAPNPGGDGTVAFYFTYA